MALSAIVRTVLPLWKDKRLRLAGIVLLGGVSLAFLLLAAAEARSAAVLARIDVGDMAIIAACGAVYGLLLVLLARGWSLAPAAQGARIGIWGAVAVYGTSILPKYVPGSILQYGSRQVLGQRLGWSQAAMAQGSLLEVALHVVCSLAVAVLLMLPGWRGEGQMDWWFLAILAALVLALVALALIARHLPWRVLVGSALFQVAFFAGMGGLAALCGWVFGVGPAQLPLVGGFFLLAWLAGFVVPLAPGGLGVREASGVAMLSGTIGLEQALVVLAAMRVVSLIGDVLMFAAGVVCQRGLRLRP